MSGPDSSNGQSIRHESEGWGGGGGGGGGGVQMLTLLKNIFTTRASIQKHGTANVWPW